MVTNLRERGKESYRGGGERWENHQIGCLLGTPQPGIEPGAFRCTGWHSNQLSQVAKATTGIFEGTLVEVKF